MAVDKLVDSTQLDADLTSVANAIRAKGGTSAQLEFPADFVDAIGDIQTGDGYSPSQIAEISGSLTNSPITGNVNISVPISTRPWSFNRTRINSAKVTATSVPGNGYVIQERLFSFCNDLEDFLFNPPPVPSGNNGISSYAFWSCIKLKKVRITSICHPISNNAFGSCPALVDIYVPWSEGEVANAPWGATNATIHYNTVFDADGEVVS